MTWGEGAVEDLERQDEKEEVRNKFLMEGNTARRVESRTRQTILRTWTETDMWCKQAVLQLIETSSVISQFRYSLTEQLQACTLESLAKSGTPADTAPKPSQTQDLQEGLTELPVVPKPPTIPESNNSSKLKN
jgi:hypothetical protein